MLSSLVSDINERHKIASCDRNFILTALLRLGVGAAAGGTAVDACLIAVGSRVVAGARVVADCDVCAPYWNKAIN